MKTCIVTLCKDEDNFLDEWINYNLKLGFDKIFMSGSGSTVFAISGFAK